jgi:hypothetical protein
MYEAKPVSAIRWVGKIQENGIKGHCAAVTSLYHVRKAEKRETHQRSLVRLTSNQPMNIPIETIIKELQKERPGFHSEADFQHAVAWEIHRHHPTSAVRLEVDRGTAEQREHLDILVKDSDRTCAIELKYKTRKLDTVFGGERFHLRNHGAQDIGRYDFIKDIVRLERFVIGNANSVGYAIFLTNDDSYWKDAKSLTTADAMFRIGENRTLNGELRWSELTGAGTMKGRESPLSLNGSHAIHWVDYSRLDVQGPGRLRYALLEVSTT